jgi:hypothetical protein
MRERWFGSTGRKIPEIALAGSVDVTGALELDDVSDVAAIAAAHAHGTPVVVNARSLAEVTAALARPEVACVLVTDPALLEVDLADIHYG